MHFTADHSALPVIFIVPCIITDDFSAWPVIYIVLCILTDDYAARPVIYIFPCILTAEPAARLVIYIVSCIITADIWTNFEHQFLNFKIGFSMKKGHIWSQLKYKKKYKKQYSAQIRNKNRILSFKKIYLAQY